MRFIPAENTTLDSIALFAKPVLTILVPVSYHTAYSIIFILIVVFLYQGGNNVIGIGIVLSKKTQYTSYAQVITFIVNIILNLLLIPQFSIWGAALALGGGVIVQGLAYYYFSQRIHPIPFNFWRMQMYSIVLFVLLLIETLIIQNMAIWMSIFIAALFILPLGLLSWLVGFPIEERHYVLAIFRKLYKPYWVDCCENIRK